MQSSCLTGISRIDRKIANNLTALDEEPAGYIWHHVEDGKTMILVPKAIHQAVPHTGSAAILRGKKNDKINNKR
jgi:hypothetical protein